MATPRKLWETNVGLRPATHIMSTFVCLAISFRIALFLKEPGMTLKKKLTAVGKSKKRRCNEND